MMETRDKVYNIVSSMINIDKDEITDESDLYKDLGCDSLDVLDLAMELEDIFDIEIKENDIHKFKTVGSLIEYIYKSGNK